MIQKLDFILHALYTYDVNAWRNRNKKRGKMKTILLLIVLCAALRTEAHASFVSNVSDANISLPEHEKAVIRAVADEYGLENDARTLLYVIRKVENGKAGKEFGVLNPYAMRYKDGIKSFKIQAQWAAGTIKKRYKGDLTSFATLWCPVGVANDPTGLNKNWYSNANHYMTKWARKE